MKCVTLWQPYASLIAVGAKTIETRSWGTDYRGLLAIHAGKKWDVECAEDCRRCMDILRAENWPDSPIGLPSWKESLGKVVAVCRLVKCEQSKDESVYAKLNREFGDLSPGRWAWCLDNIRAVVPPLPCRGSQGLWNLPVELEERLKETP